MSWMAEAVSRSADQVVDLVAYAEDLRRRWEEQLAGMRSDAAARRLVDLIPAHTVVTAPMVAELLGVSGPAARAAVDALATRGILQPLELRPTRPGRPPQWWMAGELLSVVSRWAR